MAIFLRGRKGRPSSTPQLSGTSHHSETFVGTSVIQYWGLFCSSSNVSSHLSAFWDILSHLANLLGRPSLPEMCIRTSSWPVQFDLDVLFSLYSDFEVLLFPIRCMGHGYILTWEEGTSLQCSPAEWDVPPYWDFYGDICNSTLWFFLLLWQCFFTLTRFLGRPFSPGQSTGTSLFSWSGY
jgi:hypothetical protein